jgi:hypothetical protein
LRWGWEGMVEDIVGVYFFCEGWTRLIWRS